MTDWNERYRKGKTPWEKGAPAPPLLEILEKSDREIWGGGTVLVPGCGTGHDVRALAARGLPALGLDLAEEAVQRAESHPKVGGESYQIGELDLYFSPYFERDMAWVPEAAYPGREGREWLAVYRRKWNHG